jgi:hypothetical protein
MRAMYVTHDTALPSMGASTSVHELRDRVEAIDSLYRFGLGIDLRNRDLFASALTPDGEMDFRPAGAKLGMGPVIFSSREVIVDTILGQFTGRVATTHVVTNPRVHIESDTAKLTALVEAQHVLMSDREQYALFKNLYDVTLVRDGNRWLIRNMVIDNVWFSGNPRAVFG